LATSAEKNAGADGGFEAGAGRGFMGRGQ